MGKLPDVELVTHSERLNASFGYIQRVHLQIRTQLKHHILKTKIILPTQIFILKNSLFNPEALALKDNLLPLLQLLKERKRSFQKVFLQSLLWSYLINVDNGR